MDIMRALSKTEIADIKPQLIEIRNDELDTELGDIWGMVDVFDHCMTNEECEEISFDYNDLHYRHEHKFISLMRELFESNRKSRLIIEFNYSDISNNDHIGILKELNPLEKNIWMNQIRTLPVKTETDYFEVDSLDVLVTLTYLNIREKCFMKFYFLGLGVSILGAFDCAMIIFFKEEGSIREYDQVIKRHHLHLRDVVKTRKVIVLHDD